MANPWPVQGPAERHRMLACQLLARASPCCGAAKWLTGRLGSDAERTASQAARHSGKRVWAGVAGSRARYSIVAACCSMCGWCLPYQMEVVGADIWYLARVSARWLEEATWHWCEGGFVSWWSFAIPLSCGCLVRSCVIRRDLPRPIMFQMSSAKHAGAHAVAGMCMAPSSTCSCRQSAFRSNTAAGRPLVISASAGLPRRCPTAQSIRGLRRLR